jgi:hypothetical protein
VLLARIAARLVVDERLTVLLPIEEKLKCYLD